MGYVCTMTLIHVAIAEPHNFDKIILKKVMKIDIFSISMIKKHFHIFHWQSLSLTENLLLWCAVWRCVITRCFEDNILEHSRHLYLYFFPREQEFTTSPVSTSTTSYKSSLGRYSEVSMRVCLLLCRCEMLQLYM